MTDMDGSGQRGFLSTNLQTSARVNPRNRAAIDSSQQVWTYEKLEQESNFYSAFLQRNGVTAGSRVGIYANKTLSVLSAIHGTLKLGAIYVPIDPTAPSRRAAMLLTGCQVHSIVVGKELVEQLIASLLETKVTITSLPCENDELLVLRLLNDNDLRISNGAYILFTSGSTGTPKGVIHTHSSAAAFLTWAKREFAPTECDRFSSIAPLQFDLSILDIFLATLTGASVRLLSRREVNNPKLLAHVISRESLTIIYTTPTVLGTLLEFGEVARYDFTSVRLVLVAGEVINPAHIKTFAEHCPNATFYNLYGPTETNVCSYYHIQHPGELDTSVSIPIGEPASSSKFKIAGEYGEAAPGGEGELLVSGPSLMQGYWHEYFSSNGAKDNREFFWYKTGDLVKLRKDGGLDFVGRKDRCIKRNGYRIELAEVEATAKHFFALSDAAALCIEMESGAQIVLFYVCVANQNVNAIAVKRHFNATVPPYLSPDVFIYLEEMPTNENGKIHYSKLKEQAYEFFTKC